MTDIVDDVIGFGTSFASSNPVIFFLALAVLAFLIYRRPKFFFTVLFLGFLLMGVVYLILNAASSGVSKKELLIHKGAPAEDVSGRGN